MSPTVTVVPVSEVIKTMAEKKSIGPIMEHLTQLIALPAGECVRLEFPSQPEAKRAKSHYHIYAKRKALKIAVKSDKNVLYLMRKF